jgi:hypothetical protein
MAGVKSAVATTAECGVHAIRPHTVIVFLVVALVANYPVTIASVRFHKWLYGGAMPKVRWDLSSQGAGVGQLHRGVGETVADIGARQVAWVATGMQRGAYGPPAGAIDVPDWAAFPSLPGFQVASTQLYGWPWRWARCVDQFNYNVTPVATRRKFGLMPLGLVLNTALFSACLWLGLLLLQGTIERVRIDRGCCRKCGYDLAGVERCPECGR